MKLLGTLLKNELKLSIRNMNMVIFAVTMPLIVLVVLGFIYGTKPAADGTAYTFMEQSFGALCCISICAGGLMGLPLVVSEYRERKILKRFQVTPVSPAKLLLVEFLIYVIYCIVSMLTLFPAAMLFWNVRECVHNIAGAKCNLEKIDVTNEKTGSNAVATPHFCKSFNGK